MWYWQRVRSEKNNAKKDLGNKQKLMWDPRMDMPNCPLNRIAFFVKLQCFVRLLPELLMVICCCFFFPWFLNTHIMFSSPSNCLPESDSTLKRKMCLPCDWPYLPCISVCIGCGYMVVLSHNITRMSTSIHVACETSRALVGSNLFDCGHMKCFVSNCNGKIEMKVSYLELYSSTASSLLCSCRYVLFSSQIKFPFCLAPKFTLPEISTPEKIDG